MLRSICFDVIKINNHTKQPFVTVMLTCMDPGGLGLGVGPLPPGKSQVAIGFLSNTGTQPLEKQLDASGPIES